jgi:hypothetical protein
MNIKLISKKYDEEHIINYDVDLDLLQISMEICEINTTIQPLLMQVYNVTYEDNTEKWSSVIQTLFQSFIKIINEMGKFITYIINYSLSILFNLDIPTYEALSVNIYANNDATKLQQWFLINSKRLQIGYDQNVTVTAFDYNKQFGINIELLLSILIKVLKMMKNMIEEKNTLSTNTAKILYTMYTEDAAKIKTIQSKIITSGVLGKPSQIGIRDSNITMRDMTLFFTTIAVQLIEVKSLWDDIKHGALRVKKENIQLLQNHVMCIQVITSSTLTMTKKICSNISGIVSTLYNTAIIKKPIIK